jgi:hypothetical protein
MLVIPTRVTVVVVISALVLAAGLLTLALLTQPTPAQATSERIAIGPEPVTHPGLLNPCNGEVVVITGDVRGYFQTVQTPTGKTFTKVHTVFKGIGVGSEGNTYTFNQIHTQVIAGEAPFTVTTQILLTSEGSSVNFALNQQSHVSPNGDAHTTVADPVCRGATAPHPPPPGTATAAATATATATATAKAKAQPRP